MKQKSNLGFTKAGDPKARADRTREMANYLWINYIEFVVHTKAIPTADSHVDLAMLHKSSSWG